MTPEQAQLNFVTSILAIWDPRPAQVGIVPDGGSHSLPEIAATKLAIWQLRRDGGAPGEIAGPLLTATGTVG